MKVYSHPNVPREVTWFLPAGVTMEGAKLEAVIVDPCEQRFAQGALLHLTAPGPLPGYAHHDDDEREGSDGPCDIPGCYICKREADRRERAANP